MNTIRIGLVGAGNCASALAQGLTHYSGARGRVPGLTTPVLGGYGVEAIEIVAAFDVTAEKAGAPLGAALAAAPNNTLRFAEPKNADLIVERGPTLDGIGAMMDELVESPREPVDVALALRRAGVEVLVSFLPVGSEEASRHYARAAIKAGCAFVNCIPVFLASDPEWSARFAEAGLPIVGDDVKSQVGATIVHRALAQLFAERGVKLTRTYQLNVGGNADFKGMLERERLASKKKSKTRAVTAVAEPGLAAAQVHVGPSDHVPWLEDRKVAFIRLEGEAFGGAPMSLKLELEVWDSPNSAGVVIDAIRCAKLALDRGLSGAIAAPSAYFMKSPPQDMTDDAARRLLLDFIGETA